MLRCGKDVDDVEIFFENVFFGWLNQSLSGRIVRLWILINIYNCLRGLTSAVRLPGGYGGREPPIQRRGSGQRPYLNFRLYYLFSIYPLSPNILWFININIPHRRGSLLTGCYHEILGFLFLSLYLSYLSLKVLVFFIHQVSVREFDPNRDKPPTKSSKNWKLND